MTPGSALIAIAAAVLVVVLAFRAGWQHARRRGAPSIVGPSATTSTNTDPTVRGALEQCEPWSHLVDFEGKIGEVSITPRAARSGKIPHSRYCPGCRARAALTTYGLPEEAK